MPFPVKFLKIFIEGLLSSHFFFFLHFLMSDGRTLIAITFIHYLYSCRRKRVQYSRRGIVRYFVRLVQYHRGKVSIPLTLGLCILCCLSFTSPPTLRYKQTGVSDPRGFGRRPTILGLGSGRGPRVGRVGGSGRYPSFYGGWYRERRKEGADVPEGRTFRTRKREEEVS